MDGWGEVVEILKDKYAKASVVTCISSNHGCNHRSAFRHSFDVCCYELCVERCRWCRSSPDHLTFEFTSVNNLLSFSTQKNIACLIPH